ARQLADPPPEVCRIGRLRPDAPGVAAVVGDDRRAQLLHPPRHRPRKAMDRRLLAARLLEPARVHARALLGVAAADPLPQHPRAGERRLHRHLLVERESDQEREWVARDERVDVVVAREVEPLGTRGSHRGIDSNYGYQTGRYAPRSNRQTWRRLPTGERAA